jgi:hypothetical protein
VVTRGSREEEVGSFYFGGTEFQVEVMKKVLEIESSDVCTK